MDMIFYGAGNWGKDAFSKYNQNRTENLILIGFADNKKTGNYCGYPVFSRLEIKEKDAAVVITVGDPLIVQEIYVQLYKMGIRNIYWFKNKSGGKKKEGFLKDECVCFKGVGECILAKVEMHIADHCNLNCRGCTHFSPIFEKKLPDFASRIRDVKKLKEKMPYVLYFSILGGEPFLNPDICLYITEIRKLYPDAVIDIVTNGLLIPGLSDYVLKCILDHQVQISISEYEPTHKMIERIEEKLQQFGISYHIRPYEVKKKFIKPLSLKTDSMYPQKCLSNGCVNIWNGKIARCPTLMYIEEFNKKFDQNLPNEGILQLEDCPAGFELLEILQKEVPLCKHCVCCEIDWESCKKEPVVTDFANFE